MGVLQRIKRAWNAFMANKDPTTKREIGYGSFSSFIPTRWASGYSYYDKSLAKYILNRMAVDFTSIQFKHVNLDEEGRYVGDIDSTLNFCLNQEANIDEGPKDFLLDFCSTLLDHGYCAIVPVNTDEDPNNLPEDGWFNVWSMRVGTITEWYPKKVKVKLYNEDTGNEEEIVVSKKSTVIVVNPFYTIMNEPNSILARLNRKFKIMDYIDEETTSGKLNIIIQLPYLARNEMMQDRAKARVERLEAQLKDNQYGIAYTDSTEKIVQLNRSIESNYLEQVEYLTKQFMDQLGVTPEILNGTADDKVMTNYYNRIIEPIAATLSENIKRKWLSMDDILNGESIMYFRDAFKLVPVTLIGELGDTLIRNRVLSANDFRSKLGLKPSSDPAANELMNPNMPYQDQIEPPTPEYGDQTVIEGGNINGQV